MKEKIKALLNSLLGREPTEDEVKKAVDELKPDKTDSEADKNPEQKTDTDSDKKTDQEKIETSKQLKELQELLAGEKTAREAAELENKNRAAREKAEKIDKFIESAKNGRVIPTEDKDAEARLRKLAEADFDATVATIMPAFSKASEGKSEDRSSQASGIQRPLTLAEMRAKAESGFKSANSRI